MTSEPAERMDLEIEGMTCASCAVRIEKSLNRLDGVHASVNYAAESAAVRFDPELVSVEQLVGAVRSAGYAARLDVGERDAETGTARLRLVGFRRADGSRSR